MKKKIAIATFALGIIFGTFLVPASSVMAQNPLPTDYENPDYEARLGTCSLTQWTPCFLRLYYWLILYPSNWFAYLTGSIFDYFVAYSLDTASYQGTNNTFVERGWAIMRDIANVTFIFALLYVAIKHILQAAGSETKKFLKSIIIAALLINFSLFFTKIIIDAGNILARAFYNNIEITNDDNPDHKTLSMSVVSYIKPQNILSADLFKPVDAPGRSAGNVDSGWVFLVMVVATVVNVILGLTFLSTFLLFAARVIGLWFMMIFSPIAFASIAFPGGAGFLGRFAWGEWLKQTMSLSFMAPVFMFFFFLLIMFLEVAFTTTTPFGDQSSVQKFMGIIVPFVAIIIIITQAKEHAKKMAGEFGEQATKWAGKAVGMVAGATLGLAGGAVIGGAAKLGRASIGAASSRFAKSRHVQRWAANSGVGRRFQMASEGLSKASFDFRNTKAADATSKFLGQSMGAAGFAGNVNFGKGTTKGGYVQRLEEYQKRKEDYKEKLKSSDTDAHEATYTYTDRNNNRITDTVTTSIQTAETNFLLAQNENKRAQTAGQILNPQTGAVENLSMDYESWKTQKEKAEGAQKQAETNYRIAQQDFDARRINQAQFDAAQTGLNDARTKNSQIKAVITDIERNWAEEEAIFKAVQTAKNQHDTTMLREYAQSVAPSTINTIYEIVRGQPVVGREARRGASGNIALAAEKSEKKAQAEEKKADKAH